MAKGSAGGVLVAACISALVVNANSSAIAILLPAISADTGTAIDTLQWAVTGYALVGAATIVMSGALGDVLGRRKIFLAGLVLFVASCVLIALAQNGGMVIAGRCIQGAAGATLLACGMSLLSAANSGQQQLRAVSIWGAASAVGAALGPLAGGILVEAAGWQGLFWIDAAIAAACIPLTLAAVAESRDESRTASIDILGAVLLAAALAAFILAVSEGSQWGWASAKTIGCFLASIAAIAAFVAAEKRSKAPLVDLTLLRNKILVGSALAILIAAGALNGVMYVVSLYFQDPDALAMSALQAGLAVLPVAAVAVALTPAVTPLVARIGGRRTVLLGALLLTAGFVAMAFVTGSWGYLSFVLPLVALAAGMSLQNNPATSASTAYVDKSQVGVAAGISNMARYVGISVMTAIVASIYAGVTANRMNAGDQASDAVAAAFSRASIAMAIWCASGIALAMLAARHRKPARPADYAVAVAGSTHTLPTPH